MAEQENRGEVALPILVTTKQMARLLSVSARTLRRMALAKKIAPLRVHHALRWDWRKVLASLNEASV